MDILPAIDLLGGQVVRLHQGDYEKATVYETDPASIARRWRGIVPRLHVVDLEGARAGKACQIAPIRSIIATFGPGVEVGGGVRTADHVAAYLTIGVDRVVMGTAVINEPTLARMMAERYPGRIVVAVDAKDGRVAVDGWEHISERSAIDLAGDLAKWPLSAIMYTDIARDGTRTGPNLESIAAFAQASRHPVIASGGVGSLDDLKALSRVPNVCAAIVGRALYDKSFTLEEAVAAAAGE
jgi:phosphoribosylformimino-5-aminoimidazole carboxamide ribotide isomerase